MCLRSVTSPLYMFGACAGTIVGAQVHIGLLMHHDLIAATVALVIVVMAIIVVTLVVVIIMVIRIVGGGPAVVDVVANRGRNCNNTGSSNNKCSRSCGSKRTRMGTTSPPTRLLLLRPLPCHYYFHCCNYCCNNRCRCYGYCYCCYLLTMVQILMLTRIQTLIIAIVIPIVTAATVVTLLRRLLLRHTTATANASAAATYNYHYQCTRLLQSLNEHLSHATCVRAHYPYPLLQCSHTSVPVVVRNLPSRDTLSCTLLLHTSYLYTPPRLPGKRSGAK